MKIKAVQVKNYRKILDAVINMEDSITVIAGANNSGKLLSLNYSMQSSAAKGVKFAKMIFRLKCSVCGARKSIPCSIKFFRLRKVKKRS